MSQGVQILLVAVVAVLLAGVAFAALQPGNLGDDDDGETAAEVTTTTTSTTDPDVGATTSTTTTAVDPDATTSTSQAPSSGLGTNGSGSAGDDDLANTGGLPLLVPGGLLLAGAVLSRRLLTR